MKANRIRKQSGAALVVSLVMLMVLTLLAISTMSTASLEVTMAGNEQYQQNAFQLAETAKDQFLRTTSANTTLCVNEQNPTVCDIPETKIDDMAGTFRTTSRGVSDLGVCPNSSVGVVTRFDFEIQANGTAPSNALAQHTQGWFFCSP